MLRPNRAKYVQGSWWGSCTGTCAHHPWAMEPRLHRREPVYLKLVNMMSEHDMDVFPDSPSVCAGQHVEQLHRYLGQQGYMKARRKVSRYYDEATAEAVAAWQQDHGVVPSGSFGHESRQAYLMQLVRVM